MKFIGQPRSENMEDQRNDPPSLSPEDQKMLVELGYIPPPPITNAWEETKPLGNSEDQIMEMRRMYPTYYDDHEMPYGSNDTYPGGPLPSWEQGTRPPWEGNLRRYKK